MTAKLTKRVARIIILILVLAAAPFWLPNNFGGETGYIVVSGQSMEPTYKTGDLLATRENEVKVGDVIVYKVQDGELGAGMLVVHRVVSGDPSGWITQGDNNPSADPWYPTGDDIVGVVAIHIPKAGFALTFAQSPLFIALLGSIIIGSILWPSEKEKIKDEERKLAKLQKRQLSSVLEEGKLDPELKGVLETDLSLEDKELIS